MADDAIILHFTGPPPPDPLRGPGMAPDDVGRPVGWDDRNVISLASWPHPAPGSRDTRTKAPAASHLYWPDSLQLAYPAGSMVPVEKLTQLIDAEEYDRRMHPEPDKPKRRKR